MLSCFQYLPALVILTAIAFQWVNKCNLLLAHGIHPKKAWPELCQLYFFFVGLVLFFFSLHPSAFVLLLLPFVRHLISMSFTSSPCPSLFFLLSLYIRPLLVVSGFRTSGGWQPLLRWPRRPPMSRQGLSLSLLLLCTLTPSCLCGGEGVRATTGPPQGAFTTTSVELTYSPGTHSHILGPHTLQTPHNQTTTHIYIARASQDGSSCFNWSEKDRTR